MRQNQDSLRKIERMHDLAQFEKIRQAQCNSSSPEINFAEPDQVSFEILTQFYSSLRDKNLEKKQVNNRLASIWELDICSDSESEKSDSGRPRSSTTSETIPIPIRDPVADKRNSVNETGRFQSSVQVATSWDSIQRKIRDSAKPEGSPTSTMEKKPKKSHRPTVSILEKRENKKNKHQLSGNHSKSKSDSSKENDKEKRTEDDKRKSSADTNESEPIKDDEKDTAVPLHKKVQIVEDPTKKKSNWLSKVKEDIEKRKEMKNQGSTGLRFGSHTAENLIEKLSAQAERWDSFLDEEEPDLFSFQQLDPEDYLDHVKAVDLIDNTLTNLTQKEEQRYKEFLKEHFLEKAKEKAKQKEQEKQKNED